MKSKPKHTLARPDGPLGDLRVLESSRRELEHRGRARLTHFLRIAEADALQAALGDDAPWWRTFNQGDKSWDLGPDSLAELDPARAGAIETAIHAGARGGFQYVYETIRISEDAGERAARGLPVDALLDSFNTPEALEGWRRLTGNSRVALVDGQATRYVPGHFLTRHLDDVGGKNRIAAYVLNLTPEWRAEWGGLLLFHAPNGEVIEGFVPRFNTLNVFRVPQDHSVSVVAPFAPFPRLAITGWIRGPS